MRCRWRKERQGQAQLGWCGGAGAARRQAGDGTREGSMWHLSTQSTEVDHRNGSGGRAYMAATQHARRTEEHECIRSCTQGCREGMQPGLAMPRPDAGLRNSQKGPTFARTGSAARGTPPPCSLSESTEVAGRAGVKQEAFVPAGAQVRCRKVRSRASFQSKFEKGRCVGALVLCIKPTSIPRPPHNQKEMEPKYE